jgi:GT2 family glycosyltransferase
MTLGCKNKVLVVIAAYNDLHAINMLLKELENQVRLPDEIYIFDNSEESISSELDHCGKIKVTTCKSMCNLGWSGAYMAGYKYAAMNHYTLCWFLDQDSIPQKDCLNNLLEGHAYAVKNNIKIGVVSPKVIDNHEGSWLRPAQLAGTMFREQKQLSIIPGSQLLKADLPMTSGSLIQTKNLEYALVGINGMLIDAIDWMVCLNLIEMGCTNFIAKNAILLQNLGDKKSRSIISLFPKSAKYSYKRRFYQARNKSFVIGWHSKHRVYGISYVVIIVLAYLKNVMIVLNSEHSKLDILTGIPVDIFEIFTAYFRGIRRLEMDYINHY